MYAILPTYKDFKYGLIQGQTNLREAIAAGYPGSTADHFIITNGATEALDLVFRLMARKGKKILMPRPYYYSYPKLAHYSGLETAFYDLNKGKIDWANFEKNLDGCVAVLINSPSNPTGSIQDVEILHNIERVTQKRGIYVISDEVYKDLIYERENYLFKGDHIITINSFSKTFAMCGFRVGYLYSTDVEIVKACLDTKTHTSMNTNILGQEMAYQATRAPLKYATDQVKIWKERRDLIYSGLVNLGLDLWKPEGAFYVLPKIPGIDDSNKIVNDLFYRHQMITYDGAWFGAPGRVRFSYALDTDKIREGIRRLAIYMKEEGCPLP